MHIVCRHDESTAVAIGQLRLTRQPVGVTLAFATVGASFLRPLCFHEKHALLGGGNMHVATALIPWICMQLAFRLDKRPDESHMALDGKKIPDELQFNYSWIHQLWVKKVKSWRQLHKFDFHPTILLLHFPRLQPRSAPVTTSAWLCTKVSVLDSFFKEFKCVWSQWVLFQAKPCANPVQQHVELAQSPCLKMLQLQNLVDQTSSSLMKVHRFVPSHRTGCVEMMVNSSMNSFPSNAMWLSPGR